MALAKSFIYDGDKFGSWTVIKSGSLKSSVRCICGFEKLINNGPLISGKSRSCGNSQCHFDQENLVGLRFGFLIVIHKINDIHYKCICICGHFCEVSADLLIRGIRKSCGCKKSKKDAVLTAINIIFNNYKKGAIERDLCFDLNKDKFVELITNNCYYCGSSPNNLYFNSSSSDGYEFYYTGIDRINSDLGYSLNNCVSCCWFCNRAKLNSSYEEFMRWMHKLILYQTSNSMLYSVKPVPKEGA